MRKTNTRIRHGDCRRLLKKAAVSRGGPFLHAVVTSPPYWNLRDYETEGVYWESTAWTGELGSEPHPDMYVQNMVEVGYAVASALRDDGTWWLNLGDCYATKSTKHVLRADRKDFFYELKERDLVDMPHAVAMALRNEGWFLRAVVPWVKLQFTPSPVKSRPQVSHEYVLMLSKTDSPFYDEFAVKQRASVGDDTRLYRTGDMLLQSLRGLVSINGQPAALVGPSVTRSGGHQAAFVEWMPRDLILASTSAGGVCSACGAPRARQLDTTQRASKQSVRAKAAPGEARGKAKSGSVAVAKNVDRHVGWEPTCDCNAPTVPAVVGDPFVGSGTTAVVAKFLDRDFWGCDADEDCVRAAKARVVSGKPAPPSRSDTLW